VKYALKVPYALSILAHGNPTAEVIGLDQFPDDEIPPMGVHYAVDIMVTIGVWMALLSLVLWVGTKRKWRFIGGKPFRWLLVLGGPLSIMGIEAGWWMAELGGQPWILRGIMRSSEAAMICNHLDLMFYLFAVLY